MTPADRMSIKEVSDYIGIGVNTLDRKSWRAKTGIPLIKMGRNLISYRPMLDKWIEGKWRKSAE